MYYIIFVLNNLFLGIQFYILTVYFDRYTLVYLCLVYNFDVTITQKYITRLYNFLKLIIYIYIIQYYGQINVVQLYFISSDRK